MGYCASLRRYFHGVREHLLLTPGGLIAQLVHVPGNRHDVQGLYALLKTDFRGWLLADNGYWPKSEKREELASHGIHVLADSRSNWKEQHDPFLASALRNKRQPIERRIGLYDQQFHADRTLCRSKRHYLARRSAKALTHNSSRFVNERHGYSRESMIHFQLVA